ncbi:MAG: MBOAT family O-acyltransferase [Anaerovoracaceae bacterium]
MVFSSLTFLAFFMPAVLLVYYAAPVKARNGILTAASLFFYAWGEPKYVLLMLFSTVFDYFNGLGIRYRQNQGRRGTEFLLLSIAGNLFLLGFFKYAGFFGETVHTLFGRNPGLPQLPLPIGISFYTFQTMSYTIDVYRKEIEAQKDLLCFAAYVTMFPQLIAGPIVRYRSVAQELSENTLGPRRSLWSADAQAGMTRFLAGLGKKVLLANPAGALWTEISGLQAPSVAVLWIGAVCFTFQIYFDFSGYSDMAIGLGKLLGFTFPENFHYPYTCTSITDFWRRWHMTLGSWFREYVYIPLGGNQRGLGLQLRNIMIVWMLTGLWHGAAWNFVLWGLYYGLILAAEKLFLLKLLDRLPAWFCRLYTLPVIITGWVIFASTEGSGVLTERLGTLFGAAGAPLADGSELFYLSSFGLLFGIMLLGCTPFPKGAAERILQKCPKKLQEPLKNLWLVVLLLLCLSFLASDSYNPFLYFRF